MHMHEAKTCYFRYIKPVRGLNSEFAYPYMHVMTETWKEKHAFIKKKKKKGIETAKQVRREIKEYGSTH